MARLLCFRNLAPGRLPGPIGAWFLNTMVEILKAMWNQHRRTYGGYSPGLVGYAL